MQNSEQQ
jgi:hypothetical protein